MEAIFFFRPMWILNLGFSSQHLDTKEKCGMGALTPNPGRR